MHFNMLILQDQDITYSVNKANQYMQNPTYDHWKVVKIILRYLKGTLNFGLTLEANKTISISGYAGADWVTDPDDRRSTTVYHTYLGKNSISWC